MNDRQINAFRQVMRLGSVTAAARALAVSQPAVSRLIGDLESDLGFALFDRRAGKLFPTPEARNFASEVERMFYGLARLERFARDMHNLRQGSLSVATLPMVSFQILPRALSAFLKDHNGLRVTHNVHTSPRVADLVAAGQADLGIAQTAPGRSDVRHLQSWRTDCVVALPVGHPLAGYAQITPQDLKGVAMVALSFQTVTAGYATERFAEAGIAPEIVIESQPSYSACALVAEGLGAAIVDPLTPRQFPPTALCTVPFAPAIPFDLHLLAHADQPLSRPAAAMATTLAETMDATPGVRRLRDVAGAPD
ncbi:LysR substrate-binding domain-containing protein [Oceaniglobus trochenteri]|uniref:LysR substrate-binding domain-containing protein n=1 Tax=Oceaniglobus trochenteri TaxID=2763260 RepID=UPI001CFFBF2E|nr:LysR substrate-binding domain-containing protein [Oceaniglobus trochenteri]